MNNSEYQWESACVTDVGKVRKVNEDSCLDLPSSGLWVVADGMGGHDAGDVASQMIVDTLAETGTHAPRLSTIVDDLEDRLLWVNRRLVDMAAQSAQPKTIGSTVVALVAFGHHCVFMWAGDSRIYLSRQGKLAQITQDHSQVEELVEQGLLLREDAEKHPSANVITRAVGAADELFIDVDILELQDGDRFLLCSDGLTKELSDGEIAERLVAGTCEDACKALVNEALERGCRDNVTAIAVHFNKSV